MIGTKVRKWRYAMILATLTIVIGIFCARLFRWQLKENEIYDEIALTSTEYTVSTDAIRGEIFDVKGQPLAQNTTGYRIVINKIFMPDDQLNEAICKLITLTEQCGCKWKNELPILQSGQGYRFEDDRETDIAQLKSKDNLNMNPYSTAADCMLRLVEKYDCGGYDKKQQYQIVSVRYTMEKSLYSGSIPYVFADDLDEGAMNIISENTQSDPGIEIEACAVRKYINGTTAPHIVGVTGLVSQEEYDELKEKGYAYNDIVGKLGVEYAFEDRLRGKSGSRTYEVNPDGSAVVKKTVNSQPGDSVYLTIDSEYQQFVQQVLKEAIDETHEYHKNKGGKNTGEDCVGAAAVVLNVKDFSVLCAASYPNYDISRYYTDYNKLLTTKGDPLVNRAFNGALAPGSTFKPMVASAALEEGAITDKTTFTCQGIYTKGGLKLSCMHVHGTLNLYEGIRDSCNVFFAETARLLGIEKMNVYAKRCGLGVRTGVEIGESSGTLAGPEYSEMMGTPWYEPLVSPAGIGQSDNQFTPLQLATYVATIANNGVRLKPHVVDKITDYTGKKVLYQSEPEVVDNMGVSQKNLREVQKAMNMAVNSYDSFDGFPMQIAGKTGTAENAGSDHANFICYAPYDHPQIAVAIMIEHGTKSWVAADAAEKILRKYFDIKDTKKKDLTARTTSNE